MHVVRVIWPRPRACTRDTCNLKTRFKNGHHYNHMTVSTSDSEAGKDGIRRLCGVSRTRSTLKKPSCMKRAHRKSPTEAARLLLPSIHGCVTQDAHLEHFHIWHFGESSGCRVMVRVSTPRQAWLHNPRASGFKGLQSKVAGCMPVPKCSKAEQTSQALSCQGRTQATSAAGGLNTKYALRHLG